jgi:transcriptional regulator with XRE-family HTH domain
MAQGISQRDVASHLGIHQGSVAQFETGRSKLSLATLVRMAPFLNLNPAFVETGTGRPFKPRQPGEVIKLLLSPNPESGADLYLLNLILTKAEKTQIVVLLPPLEQAKGKLGTAGFYYAVTILDDQGTAYLLRAKHGERLTGSLKELQVEMDAIASKDERTFQLKTVRVTKEMFEKLRTWSILRVNELSPLLPRTKKAASRQRLLRLVDAIFSDQKEKETVKKAAAVIDQEEVDLIVGRLKTELKTLLSGKGNNTDKSTA